MILGLVISLISLIIIFYFVDLRKVMQALKLADFRFILLGIALTLLWLVVRGFAWRTLLSDRPTFNQTFITINEGYLLNNFLPFRLGEVARAFLLGNKTGMGFWQVFPSVMIERIMDLGMAVGVLLVSLALVVGADWALQAAAAAGVIVLTGFIILFLLARYREKAIKIFDRIGELNTRLKRLIHRTVPPFLQGLSVLTNGKLFLRAVFWIVLDWLIAIVQYYILMLAFYPDAQILWAALVLGVASIGIAAPSSPGALGVMELSIVAALSVFGKDPSSALAFGLTAHAIQYLVTGIIGIYGLTRDGESFLDVYRRARQVSQTDAQ